LFFGLKSIDGVLHVALCKGTDCAVANAMYMVMLVNARFIES